jgi:tetratricopeptide (TPR) repeat protein
LFQRALVIREKAFGPDHLVAAQSLFSLAVLYQARQSRYAEAEQLYQRSLAIREKVLGREHRVVAMLLTNLANLYRNQGRYTAFAKSTRRRRAGAATTRLAKHHQFLSWHAGRTCRDWRGSPATALDT